MDISKITLPSGTTYDIKDAVARQMISGGVSFIIAWDGASTPVVGNIPAGVKVTYNETQYTGTLSASDQTVTSGAFYLVKSSSTPSGQSLDIYDEYVPIGAGSSKTWEKIGDTQLNLTDVVTDVTFSKQTDTVIGTDATFTITQPTISLSTSSSSGTGKIPIVTGITSVTPSGDDDVTVVTGYSSPSTAKVIGSSATFTHTDPTYSISAGASGTSVATGITPTTSYVKATASGGAVSASGDSVTAVTGYSSTTTDNFVKTLSSTAKKLATTTVTGVSGSTTASKATNAASQTTADGTYTQVSAGQTANQNILCNISYDDTTEVLTINACTLDTQTTTQHTFSDVTVPVASSSATTVATGSATTTGSGATFITTIAAGSTAAAMTGLGTPSTDTVLGTASTFTVTNPTISLAKESSTGTGKVAINDYTATTTHLSISKTAAGSVSFNSKDEKTVLTGLGTPSTDSVLGADTTFGGQASTAYAGATASGANTAWNNKDSVTVLTNASSVTVTKGS